MKATALIAALLVAASALALPAAGSHGTPCTTPATVTPAGIGYLVVVVVSPTEVHNGYYIESNGIADLQRGGHALGGLDEDCYDSPHDPDTLVYMVDAGTTPIVAYYSGVVRIESVGGAAPTATDGGLDCSPLTWDGAHAEVSCVPSLAAPPGVQWRCFGLQVAAGAVGAGDVTGSIGCGGATAASCTAVASPTGLVSDQLCADMSGPVDSGDYPLTCRADVNGHATLTAWTVFCGNPDP